MAEETADPVVGGGGTPAIGLDSEAMSLALPGASRAEADALLRQQRHFIALQTEHLHEQRELQLSRLRLGRLSDLAKVTLQVMTGVVGGAIAVALLVAMWNASRTQGMEVEAFSVPPQFAQSGISGEALADDFTDRLATVRDTAVGNSIASSGDVRKDSSENIKVEIPETGISLGQAWRYLRLWLGHERHIGGNLRSIGEGRIALTIALDGKRVAAASGMAGDLSGLEQQAAEQAFANAEPRNYVLYLIGEGRVAEGFAAVEHLAQRENDPVEQANAYSLWAGLTRSHKGDPALTIARARLSMKLNPKLMASHREMMWAFVLMGHDQEALREAEAMQRFQEKDQPAVLKGSGFAEMAMEGAFMRNIGHGAFAQAVSDGYCRLCSQTAQSLAKAEFVGRAHDGTAARALLAEAIASGPASSKDRRIGLDTDIARARYFERANIGDWPAATASARLYAAQIRNDPVISPQLKALKLRLQVAPLLAHTLANGGDPAGAEAEIAGTPGDCYDCVRTRALIWTAAGQWARADYWSARAVHEGPSLPFAYADWGLSLLARGQPDAAIEKFKLANERGPHFADPLEMWGEALMAKNQSHLALAKFTEAEKYAPNWGRLHLKWGEALAYAGKHDDAKTQFARAGQLDLTPPEKSELAKVPHV